MYCTKCAKHHAGYRCPYCGEFLLDDPALKDKNYSIYDKQMKKDSKKNWPAYIFLFLFIAAWLTIVILFIT